MLQTDNATSTSTLPSLTMPKLTNQVDIVKRLEELNKWQEAQKKLLEAKQNMQRQMLGMEQRTMYQMLGLQSDEDISEVDDNKQDISGGSPRLKQRLEPVESSAGFEEYEENSENTVEYGEMREVPEKSDKSLEPSYKTLTSGYATEEVLEVQLQKPKKPYLKRGEGLKQRFKIDPEELRITNLPKYKYANAHPRLKMKPGKSTSNATKSKALPNPPSTLKNSAIIDAQEQRFQQLLISSKNVCNSTPDMKSSLVSNKNTSTGSSNNSSTLPKVRFVESSMTSKNNMQECPPFEGPSLKTQTIAWAKILDPQQIQPLPIIRKGHHHPAPPQRTEDDIFEMLEEKAKNDSFDMDSTCIRQFMARRLSEKFNDTDVIPINDLLKTKRLQPLVQPSSEAFSLEDDSFATEDNTEADVDIPQTYEDSTISSHTAVEKAAENHVRFSESHDTHEYQEEGTVTETSSMIMAGGEGDHTNPEFFEQFKQALFAALQFKAEQHNENETQNSTSDSTLTPKDSRSLTEETHTQKVSEELQEKTQLIKMRLQELEKEIATFKENNLQLMKAKQEHELAKALHAQEQLEAEERLKDEKIQMEIYLHDERMKLEEEKRKYEQQIKIKSQATVAKERKEIEKLRQQVNQLETQLKAKESNHASAQARWRTQIRSMEREEKRLHEQIEALTKENKRLDAELLKMSRDNNNKLLHEINRNIAKLAPKQTQHATTSFPEESSPPVLPSGRTMSKTIVATAAANKNFKSATKSPQQRAKKVQKSNHNNLLKQCQPQPDTPSSEEAESTPEPSFNESKTANYKQQQDYLSFDEDEEDILQELQTSPGPKRRTNIPVTKNGSVTNKGDTSPKTSKAPPSSPRDMKREIVNSDGSKDIWYPNGNLKKISSDGMLIRMLYYNKDIKETNINEGTVKYYYAETNTWHTTYLDGLEILEFPNGQVEHRHKNGVIEVHYPNNSVKIMDPRDDKKLEEWRFPDGTHLVQMRNGDKILSLPNGQKEIHTKMQKRREYPDGTVKIVYPDGSTETRYSNGRIRLKDKDGNLVMDTEVTT